MYNRIVDGDRGGINLGEFVSDIINAQVNDETTDTRTHKISCNIVPNKFIYDGTIKKILQIDEKYIIKEIEVVTCKGKITSVKITKGIHTNCDPDTGQFCIPNNIKNIKFDDKSLSLIKSCMKILNLDHSYFDPWGELVWANYNPRGD